MSHIIKQIQTVCLDNQCIIKRNKYKNQVISVTGTSGKTTTVKMIHDIIKSIYTVNKTYKNCNTSIGIPFCVNSYFNLNSKFWIIEIGIIKINEMIQLLNLVKPNIRVITNINEAHTDTFASNYEYQIEKLKYLENLPPDTVLIINMDDEILSSLNFNSNIKVIKVGCKDSNDIQLLDYQLNSDNISSTVKVRIFNDNIIKFKLNSIGFHYGIDACLAIGCAYYLNIPINIIKSSLDKFTFYKNRGSIIVKPSYTLYDYTFNCVIYACLKNLESFKNIKNNNKLIILGSKYGIKSNDIRLEQLLDSSIKITNNIIIYSKKDFTFTLDSKYSNFNPSIKIYYNFDSILNHIKFLIKNQGHLSIFIQASNEMKLFNFTKNIKL